MNRPLAAAVLVAAAAALPARAEMIGTPDLLAPPVRAQHASVDAFLAREDVQRQLEALGVSPAKAATRVAGLTGSELQALSSRIDALPAGAGVSTIELLLIIIIIILLV